MIFFLLTLFYFLDLKILFIYLFQERGREGDVREIHQLVASHMHPTRGLAINPAMCPDWEWN